MADENKTEEKVSEPEKTFTQEQLNKVIEERLAIERKKHEKDRSSLMQQVEALNLSTKQKEALEAQLEEIRMQGLSKEEQAKAAAEKERKDFERQLKDAQGKHDSLFQTYSSEKLSRELVDAAVRHDAFNPEQIVEMLLGRARVADELDEANKPTGRRIVRVKLDVTREGKRVSLDLTPDEAVNAMKGDVERFGNLFKAKIAGGLGATAPAPNGKAVELKNMSMDELHKRFKENRQTLGLR